MKQPTNEQRSCDGVQYRNEQWKHPNTLTAAKKSRILFPEPRTILPRWNTMFHIESDSYEYFQKMSGKFRRMTNETIFN